MNNNRYSCYHQSLILPRLWIGNSYSRKMTRWLQGEIGLVINCTPDLSLEGGRGPVIRCAMIDGRKGEENWKAMKKGADAIRDFFQTDQKKGVLVHCHQGLNRSASVIGCYLVLYLKWTGDMAINWIRQKRPGSLYYLGFRKMLWKWERERDQVLLKERGEIDKDSSSTTSNKNNN